MQELVAELLRAMGYKTRISPSGAERGKTLLRRPTALVLKVHVSSLKSNIAREVRWALRTFAAFSGDDTNMTWALRQHGRRSV
jgi:hypothetical protein